MWVVRHNQSAYYCFHRVTLVSSSGCLCAWQNGHNGSGSVTGSHWSAKLPIYLELNCFDWEASDGDAEQKAINKLPPPCWIIWVIRVISRTTTTTATKNTELTENYLTTKKQKGRNNLIWNLIIASKNGNLVVAVVPLWCAASHTHMFV